MAPYRGRFAPSPTGPLHQGSLLAALASWLMARRAGGQWLVRIEDIDHPRAIAGAADQQIASLARLGLLSDLPIVRQSQRQHLYLRALEQLLDSGQAFECHCSRQALTASKGIHHTCIGGRVRETPSVRLRVDDQEVGFRDALQGLRSQCLATEVGDFVLRRADGLWAYQLAVVVDDAEQTITEVVRGADLLDSTPRQIALQAALGFPHPQYAHIPLLLDPQGNKLSKSQSAQSIDTYEPLMLLRDTWRLLGQAQLSLAPNASLNDWLSAAVKAFDHSTIPRQAIICPG